MNIYRKLKSYIHETSLTIESIFGTLMSQECEFNYEKNGEFKTYWGCGVYDDDMEYLLDYYVAGIHPKYKIVNDKIIPYLSITLVKNWRELA